MTELICTSPALQNLICFLMLTVCFFSFMDAILLWRQKRYAVCAVPAAFFAAGYFALHVCREGTELRLKGAVAPTALIFLHEPILYYVGAIVLLFAGCALLYADIRRWRKKHISPSSIKESIDGLPAGICYYMEGGRCVLTNHRMNKICFSLTGGSLQNGALFYGCVKDKAVHALSDGTAVFFRHRVISHGGMILHELIADDITELYEKNRELRRDNERAERLSANMKAYGETISDTVRRQEILQAKINIHDRMNQMILSTQRAADGPECDADADNILDMWENQALLLCKEAKPEESSNVVSDLNLLGLVVGTEIVWSGDRVKGDSRALSLFLLAAREAIANAAKHAAAKHIYINIKDKSKSLEAEFKNDGTAPRSAVEETGGLLNLRRRLESAGGQMSVSSEGEFCLSITVPKGETGRAV